VEGLHIGPTAPAIGDVGMFIFCSVVIALTLILIGVAILTDEIVDHHYED